MTYDIWHMAYGNGKRGEQINGQQRQRLARRGGARLWLARRLCAVEPGHCMDRVGAADLVFQSDQGPPPPRRSVAGLSTYVERRREPGNALQRLRHAQAQYRRAGVRRDYLDRDRLPER